MRLARSLPLLLLTLALALGCSREASRPPATDFVLRDEDALLEAWGDPEDLSWEEDGTKVLLYLEEIQMDHAPDLITSTTYVPARGGSFETGPITTVDTWEGTQYVTEHRFWVNDAGIIIRCDSRLR